MAGDYIDRIFITGGGNDKVGAGTIYPVQTPSGALYMFFIEGNSQDVQYRKSVDGGRTWGAFVTVSTAANVALAVWYDRWSGINAGLIHLAYTDSTVDDTFYRTVDTESSDTLSTETVIFAGVSTANGGHLSITRARGGNVYCKTVIDAGAEGGFFRLPNANVPNGAWDAAKTADEAIQTQDQMILLPGFAADNQDIMAFFWDSSVNEVSRKLYDDSADTWVEDAMTGTMTDTAATGSFPHWAAAVDLTNSQNILIAWSAVDSANADLRCWKVTESAITEVTNVVLNSVDDQGLAALAIDTNRNIWYAFYCGKSDGSETWSSAVKVYYKYSSDAGATWSAEITMVDQADARIGPFNATPRFTRNFLLTCNITTNAASVQQHSVVVHGPPAAPRGALFQIGG